MDRTEQTSVFGVDGCRGGWLCAGLTLGGDDSPTGFTFQLYDRFTGCLAATGSRVVVVDIPIGLLDTAEPGGRPCDRHARKVLRPPRQSSVFPPPARPALHATEYREAIRLNGRGISQQAFHIIPKIREVDECITPADQGRLYEGHPELSFMQLAGAGIEEPKRTSAGKCRRLVLIESEIGTAIDVPAVRERLGRKHVAIDDILDAAVLAITARDITNGTGRRVGGDERDARGLEMAMWY